MLKLSLVLLPTFAMFGQTYIQQNYDVRAYQFTRTVGAGVAANLSSSGSGKVLSFTSAPKGIAFSGSGATRLYISGGTGAAEAALITATTCPAAGIVACTVTITTANAHSGAWAATSGSGGVQEAVCSTPVAGGVVAIVLPITLTASVSACGKTNVVAKKYSGATISGAFTIFGVTPSATNESQSFITASPALFSVSSQRVDSLGSSNWAAVAGNLDLFRVGLNNPTAAHAEWGADTAGVASAIAGVADLSTVTNILMGVGIQGAVRGGNMASVGVLGNCVASVTPTAGCWGSNFVATSDGVFTNLWGGENDINIAAAPATTPNAAYGQTAVSAAYQLPSGTDFMAFHAEKAAISGHPHYPWRQGFGSADGASDTAFYAGAASLPETTTRTFATLPAAVSGINTAWRCTNCQQTTPCLAGGTGAIAQGVSGAWDCSPVTTNSQKMELQGIDATNGLHPLSRMSMDGGGNLMIGTQTSGGTGSLIGFQSPIGTAALSIWPTNGAISQAGTAFASLGSTIAGKFVYCTNCNVATPCTGGGGGAWAFSNASQWKCPF